MVADDDFIAYEHILPQGYALPDARARTDMDKVPHTGASADLRALVNDGAGVNGDAHLTIQRQGHGAAIAGGAVSRHQQFQRFQT